MSSSTIPQATKDAVNRRADDKCEFSQGVHDLDYCHITHRGLGGRKGKWIKIIHDPRNVVLLTRQWHDVLDNRVKVEEGIREKLLLFVRLKTGWHEWAKENGIYIEESKDD